MYWEGGVIILKYEGQSKLRKCLSVGWFGRRWFILKSYNTSYSLQGLCIVTLSATHLLNPSLQWQFQCHGNQHWHSKCIAQLLQQFPSTSSSLPRNTRASCSASWVVCVKWLSGGECMETDNAHYADTLHQMLMLHAVEQRLSPV